MDPTWCGVLTRLAERRIRLEEVADATRIGNPELIEDYRNDRRGPSCLILCKGRGGAVDHVQCSCGREVWLITEYRPDAERWTDDFRERTNP